MPSCLIQPIKQIRKAGTFIFYNIKLMKMNKKENVTLYSTDIMVVVEFRTNKNKNQQNPVNANKN